MTIKDMIEELQSIDKDAKIESIGTYSGIDRSAEYCIHTDKGEYDIGKIETI